MGEMWREVKGYESKYIVSNKGRVASRSYRGSGMMGLLSQRPHYKGYKRVVLYDQGKKIDKYTHRLVVEAFIGSIPQDMVCNHINGIKDDNRLVNLEICTLSNNFQHAIDTGLRGV